MEKCQKLEYLLQRLPMTIWRVINPNQGHLAKVKVTSEKFYFYWFCLGHNFVIERHFKFIPGTEIVKTNLYQGHLTKFKVAGRNSLFLAPATPWSLEGTGTKL